MITDPSQRVLPRDRKAADFAPSCCIVPITWDTDINNWDETPEVFSITYYKIVPTLIYVGPE